MFDYFFFLFSLCGLLYIFLDASTNALSFSYPFFITACWFNFYTKLLHSNLSILLYTCTLSGLEHTEVQCKKVIGDLFLLIWPSSFLKKIFTPPLPGAHVIIIKTFLHPVLNFFHNLLRILSNVNSVNGRIYEVIVSLRTLVQAYPVFPFNNNI